ncbi:DUF1330 domain-containing protein [Novosphingobium sp. G106]|uniref:DUF1330 domain-containing protein n=1 Tax=Novosphingobium sp. G106 TaxID=2849500 RepID=UPI001C2D5FB7|nr:DUF1330 domain-containing protein [Novosphingobium sp. G106]MBV1686876.1 DUF1330 domain-containing protein [Novosphingobium sp. G106]
MAAYVVFIREGEVVDQASMDAYLGSGASTPPPAHLKALAVYGDMETIEGEGADGIVILEFPDVAAAREWYNGPYNERAKLRQKAAPYRGFIVAGL